MIFLDTNTFYYASGLSSSCPCDLEKLNTIIESNDIAISIATMYEFVYRWKSDITKIHLGGKFIADNKIKIFGNPYYMLPQNFPSDWEMISQDQIDCFVEKISSTKIDAEARLSTIVFSICFISASDFIVKETSIENKTNEFYANIMRAIMKMMNEVDIDVFRNILREGYSTGDCEDYVRKCFDNYMEFWLQCFVPILKKANEVDSYEEYVNLWSDTDWDYLSNQISKKISKNETTALYIKKSAKKYWKKINDDHLEEFSGNLRESINKKIPHKSTQEYIVDIVRNILLNGSAFWKNDIIDAIIMSHIRNEGDILITFDQGAINHMEKHLKKHPIYSTSLDLIKQLTI